MSRSLFWLIIFFTAFFQTSFAQETETTTATGSTEKTSFDPDTNAKDWEPEKRDLLVLIVKKPAKALVGNRCFEEYLYTLGLEMQLASRAKPVHARPLLRFFHNTGVRIKTSFKKGPFWGVKMRKKRKECRQLMHDYMG